MSDINEKTKSTGTENSSGSPLSHSSGFAKEIEKNPEIKKPGENPFGVKNPESSDTPGGAPEAAGTGTSSPHISENPDNQ
ncbi:MAG: hypothetical protein ABI778_10365 [Ignavibacteriota bacterium]